MEEQKLVERPLMALDEFKDYLKDDLFHLRTYEAVKRFKSVRRAIRRGHVSTDGVIYPNRPFNNTKHKKSSLNDKKRRIYEQLKYRQRKSAY